MKKFNFVLVPLLSICLSGQAVSQTALVAPGNKTTPPQANSGAFAPRGCDACIRAHMEFLASDALRGRGSATADELVAATYVASQLRQYGIAPAGDEGGYLQRAPLLQAKFTAPPQLSFAKSGAGGETVSWAYGKDFVTPYLSDAQFSGPLRVITLDEDDPQTPGVVVLILGSDAEKIRAKARGMAGKGIKAAIIAAGPERAGRFAQLGNELPILPSKIAGQDLSALAPDFNFIEATTEAVKTLEGVSPGTIVTFIGAATEEKKYTWNAIGILRGADPGLRQTAVLLSAHLDHLGIGQTVKGDNIYNGADDDASGTTAVLELARFLGRGPRPRRTVVFALFGSEETGGQGSTYFLQHPPVPLKQIAANIEFEMLGRADPLVKSDVVWLSGWERSNLGPRLAARGARLVGDPHPEQNFFERSDNFVLAKKGVVAQTVSSYGLHKDYHQPSDDVAHIDFKHMNAAIGSLLGPINWLVNSSFAPQWNEGGKP
jgi:aminopeptidase YwaD